MVFFDHELKGGADRLRNVNCSRCSFENCRPGKSGDAGLLEEKRASIINGRSYNLSFTAASLLPEMARVVAEYYLAAGDWDLAKRQVVSSNALQCRNASSAVRLERELRHRLQRLTHDQIVLLSQATAEDRAAMAWLATVKHVIFGFEFAAEVLREKLAMHDPVLRHSDYETYLDNKSVSHPELVKLSKVSKNKVRQFFCECSERLACSA